MEKIAQNVERTNTQALKLVLAWGFVGIPLLAGVTQTIINAAKLFQ
jgi:hypothetical protein